MKNFVSNGRTMVVTAAAVVSAGAVVVAGGVIGVATEDAAIGEDVSLDIEGVFELPKLQAADVSQGDSLIWDVNPGRFILTGAGAGDILAAAVAVEDADTNATTVLAKLTPGAGTVNGA